MIQRAELRGKPGNQLSGNKFKWLPSCRFPVFSERCQFVGRILPCDFRDAPRRIRAKSGPHPGQSGKIDIF